MSGLRPLLFWRNAKATKITGLRPSSINQKYMATQSLYAHIDYHNLNSSLQFNAIQI
jgi:hypothetical protein